MLPARGQRKRGPGLGLVVIRSGLGAKSPLRFFGRKEIMFGTLGGPELFLILLIALIVSARGSSPRSARAWAR